MADFYNAENILVGAAAVWLGTDEAEEPTDINTVASIDAINNLYNTDDNWTAAGYTTGGVEVTYTPDFGEVEVDQLLDAAVMFKQRMTVTVGTTLAEATLENLIFAWGQEDDTLTGGKVRIVSGNLGDRPVERQLAFVGQAPVGNVGRAYHLHRCLNVESSAHSLSRADATTIPVSLRCLPNNSGEYGTITDIAAPPAGP